MTHGVQKTMTAQVCEVNKPLLSVRRMVEAGNRVVLDRGGSYVEYGRTKERLWLKESDGMYMLKLWVPKGGVYRFFFDGGVELDG